ncbi:hypothetical protein [Pedobacter deserti]|uniref:hypothetical protein n=1 Tax=Pedobacter deserti TaxID=2817382 RepID=UPI00210F020E|nr:hypothetical protein [Pedobacter sp. SYSU D00382]
MKVLTVILIVLLIPVLLILINRIKSGNLEKKYPALGQGAGSENFVLLELELKGQKLEYVREEGIADRSEEMRKAYPGLEPGRYWPKDGGYVCFDTLKNLFMVATTEYVVDKSGMMDELKHVCFFDVDGRASGHISEMYNIKQEWRKHSILLPDHIPNFPNWKADRSELQLRHFGVEEFRTHWLNPFRGMGSPTGVGSAPAWAGTGYFDLHVEGETIRFRSPATRDGFLLQEPHDFGTDLSYCKFPRSFARKVPAFLVYKPSFGQGRVFMVKQKR